MNYMEKVLFVAASRIQIHLIKHVINFIENAYTHTHTRTHAKAQKTKKKEDKDKIMYCCQCVMFDAMSFALSACYSTGGEVLHFSHALSHREETITARSERVRVQKRAKKSDSDSKSSVVERSGRVHGNS